MSTETATDIAALVGEMEAPECEHSQHGTGHSAHVDGPATHYVLGVHCGEPSSAYAACGRMVAWIAANMLVRCGRCHSAALTGDMYKILGPVTK